MITNAISQSFFVTEQTGYFLTKVRLFVHSKSDSAPLKVEVREMENGYPSTRVLKYAQAIINPSDITADANTPSPHDVVFETPVFLSGEETYCITISSDSNEYKMWGARFGEPDIVTGKLITSQPELGVFFYSQNGSTWQARETDDLMFELYRAKFSTNVSAQVSMTNADIGWAKMRANPIYLWSGKSKARIRANVNGMRIGDYVMLDGVSIGSLVSVFVSSGGSGYTQPPTVTFTGGLSAGGRHAVANAVVKNGVIVGVNVTDAGDGYISAPTISFSNGGAGSGGASAIAYITDGSVNIKSADFNKVPLKVTNIDKTSFMVDIGVLSNFDGELGGSKVSIKRNIKTDIITPKGQIVQFPNTDVKHSLRIASSSDNTISTGMPFNLNDIIDFDDTKIILSDKNESEFLNGQKSLEINTIITTNNEYVSPIVDLSTMAITLTANKIGDWSTQNSHVDGYDDVTILDGATVTPTTTGFVVTTPHGDTLRLYQGKSVRVSGFKNFVSSVKITNSGIGYATTPSVTIPAPSTSGGVSSTATATIGNGELNTITVDILGSGYITSQSGASVTIAAPNAPLWLVGTSYDVDSVVKNSVNNVYIAKTSGVGGTEPTHTSGVVSNGQVQWQYLGPLTQATATIELDSNNGDFIIHDVYDDTPSVGNTTVVYYSTDIDTPLKSLSDSTEPVSSTVVYKLLERNISIVASKNTANDFNYITNVVDLTNTSTGFRAYFDANLPPEAKIYALYRICSKAKRENIHDIPWTIINPVSATPTTKNINTFTEITYENGETVEFDQIQFKISGMSSNTAAIPRIKNFRLIALA